MRCLYILADPTYVNTPHTIKKLPPDCSSTFIDTWIHSLMQVALQPTFPSALTTETINNSDHIYYHIYYQSSRVKLAISQSQVRHSVWCHGLSMGTLVGFLLPYSMEDKEFLTEQLDMHQLLPELNMNVVQASVTCLLLQIILATCLWLQSLRNCRQPHV